MPNLHEVSQWLLVRLSNCKTTEIWIFGSVTKQAVSPNDVDVFVKLMDDELGNAHHTKGKLIKGFVDHFGIPLHLLVLSESESVEAKDFLQKALATGVRVK